MRNKKELKSLVEKRTNYRNEEIQQELEKYKEDIESYIENRLMECIRQHYSYCNIYFEDIYKIIKNKKRSKIYGNQGNGEIGMSCFGRKESRRHQSN